MLIKNEQLVVELASDEAYVTVSFDVWVVDGDFERHSSIREVVALSPRPRDGSLVHEGLLPSQGFVRPRPTATWKELHRTHRFTVRRPLGIWPVRFKGYIEIAPAVEYTDKKYTSEGVVPPNYAATPAIQHLSGWFANLVSKFTKRRGP